LRTLIRNLSLQLAGLLAAGALLAGTLPADESAWQEMDLRGKARNRFEFTEQGIVVRSETSISALYTSLPGLDLQHTPILSWRWRVDLGFEPADLQRRGHDDRPLAVFVAFSYDPQTATPWERFIRPVVVLLKGKSAPGRLLVYIWGGVSPSGSWVPSPHMRSAGGMKILRPGDSPTGRWYEERTDVAADYERCFGHPAPTPMYVGIGADTDDTRSRSEGVVAELGFRAAVPP